MNKANETKTCANCKFYYQFRTLRGIKYVKIDKGFCVQKRSKERLPNNSCEFWQDIAITKAKTKQSIIKKLEQMSRQIEQIAVYLENEKTEY